jgi:hypothetical protein
MSDLVFESTTTMDQSSFAVWVEARPAHDGHHYELLSGRIVMTPHLRRARALGERGAPGALAVRR